MTDILSSVIFSVSIPQLAPVLMLFPTVVVYYTIKKYGLMNPKHVDEDAILLTAQIRTKIINYMSYAFIAGGLLNFISQYLLYDQANLKSVLIFSGFLIFIGFVFQSIQYAIKSNNTKDILNAIIFSLIVPVITLKFVDYASVTIWAFPFLLLIITLVFGSGYIQITLTISILLTQIIVWLIKPEVTLTIATSDHVARLGLYIITICFAFFVKKIYMAKLSENAEQINTQKLITEISSDFISVNERNIDDKIEMALAKLGSFTKADRVYVYLFDVKKENLICKQVWFNNGKMTDANTMEIVNACNFPMIMQHLQGGNTIAISDTADILAEMGDEIPRFVNSYEKALIAMPLVINDVIFGFLGVDAERKIKMWHDSQLGFFRIITNILGDALEKVNQEREINYMAFYDYLTKLPNRSLFKDRVTQAINLAGRTDKVLSVIFMDLDAFKAVNDSIGHDGGDSLLVKVSEKLSELVRKSDTVSRFGGDEFLILLNNLNSTDDIAKIIEKSKEFAATCDVDYHS